MTTRRNVLGGCVAAAVAGLLPVYPLRAAALAGDGTSDFDLLVKPIRLAVQAYKAKGAHFDPFLVKMLSPDEPIRTIGVTADADITYYIPKGKGEFLPLGDLATLHHAPFRGTMLVAPAPGMSAALAHPAGFKNVANGQQMSYWAMLPPPGYKAVGICVTDDWKHPPKREDYWCVADDYVVRTGCSLYWSDKGSKASDNCNLLVASPPDIRDVADTEMLFLPPTLLAQFPECSQGYALRMRKAYLDVPRREAVNPQNGEKHEAKDVLPWGISEIAVLPGIGFDTLSMIDNPFVFLALKKWWRCQNTNNLPGVREIEYTVGSESTDSNQFREKTGMKITAEAGAEGAGFSAKISASYEKELELTTNHSETNRFESKLKYPITVPDGKTSAFWQKIGSINLYGSAGDTIATTGYSFDDPRQTNY